jgi:hypothetical protein
MLNAKTESATAKKYFDIFRVYSGSKSIANNREPSSTVYKTLMRILQCLLQFAQNLISDLLLRLQ